MGPIWDKTEIVSYAAALPCLKNGPWCSRVAGLATACSTIRVGPSDPRMDSYDLDSFSSPYLKSIRSLWWRYLETWTILQFTPNLPHFWQYTGVERASYVRLCRTYQIAFSLCLFSILNPPPPPLYFIVLDESIY